MVESNYKLFVNELHKALQNLYDPGVLRKSELILLFQLSSRPNQVASLQDIVLKAIQSIQPTRSTPPQANAWRIYHVLVYRYVEQTGQPIVANNMALSVRQLRRLEREAEGVLAEYLWNLYHLEDKSAQEARTQAAETEEEDEPEAGETVPSREMELEWLKDSFPDEQSSIPELVGSVLKVIQPLTAAYQVEIVFKAPEDQPPVSGQLALVRQAITNLLSAMMQAARGTEIVISADAGQEGVWLAITCPGGQPRPNSETEDRQEHFRSAQQLIELFQGRFEMVAGETPGSAKGARLFLPVQERIHVLVVDDNTDTLRLFQRYLAGTRYSFSGAKDVRQALEFIEENPPRIVVLDVMMPGIEDWEMLGRIRTHPQTQIVPVIVCTILPQEQLARALGAAGFLRKPVSRQDLLSALDQQLGQSLTE